MKDELLKKYKKIYHTRIDKVTVNAFLLVLDKEKIGWRELSKAFSVNNKQELLDFLKENI